MLTCKHAPSWLAQRCHTDHFAQCSALLSLIMSRAFFSVMHRFKIEKVKRVHLTVDLERSPIRLHCDVNMNSGKTSIVFLQTLLT